MDGGAWRAQVMGSQSQTALSRSTQVLPQRRLLMVSGGAGFLPGAPVTRNHGNRSRPVRMLCEVGLLV